MPHDFLTVLVLLCFGHSLADYPLQGQFLSDGKNRHTAIGKLFWPYYLSSHATIHAGFVLIITVLLPMGLLSCRRCAGVCCTDNLVDCFDGGLDVFALENERRKKAKDRLAGAVDDDVAIHELGGHAFRQIC